MSERNTPTLPMSIMLKGCRSGYPLLTRLVKGGPSDLARRIIQIFVQLLVTMSVPDSLDWMKKELFNEDLSPIGDALLVNEWFYAFCRGEELDLHLTLEHDSLRCEIFEEFIRGFFLDEEALPMYDFLTGVDYQAEIMDEEQWKFYHSYMLVKNNINQLSDITGDHGNPLGLNVKVTDSYFVRRDETRSHSYSIDGRCSFVIEAEVEGVKKRFLGRDEELNFCEWRKDGECPYCGEFDTEIANNFSEWLTLKLEDEYSQD